MNKKIFKIIKITIVCLLCSVIFNYLFDITNENLNTISERDTFLIYFSICLALFYLKIIFYLSSFVCLLLLVSIVVCSVIGNYILYRLYNSIQLSKSIKNQYRYNLVLKYLQSMNLVCLSRYKEAL